MYDKFLLWQSRKVVGLFVKLQTKLWKLNEKLTQSVAKHDAKIETLNSKKAVLSTTIEKHNKAIKNIGSFIEE